MFKTLAVCGVLAGLAAGAGIAAAQTAPAGAADASQPENPPGYLLPAREHSLRTVNFGVGGSISVTLRGTALMSSASGQAQIQIKQGSTQVDAKFKNIGPARQFGPEYLTYVLWAVAPDGQTRNLGEVQLSGNSSEVKASTTFQDFGLIVTAEPYYAVSRPTNMIVLETAVAADAAGVSKTPATFYLLKRGDYRFDEPFEKVTVLQLDPKAPLGLYEAENAVRIADWAGARKYASAAYASAARQLQQARTDLASKAGENAVATAARQAVQTAEGARLLSLRRQNQEKEAQLRAKAAARVASAEADASRANARAQRAEAAQHLAELEVTSANAKASIAHQQAASAQEQARILRAREQQERNRLRNELSSVLKTKDTAKGLIMNMPDVTFAPGSATLEPATEIKLAKIAGILLSYPDLNVQIDGYTDNTGSRSFNQALSQSRANSVGQFLASQGVNPNSIEALGFGEDNPIASNDTAAGRQKNRRVELVVSGAAIGSPQAAAPARQ